MNQPKNGLAVIECRFLGKPLDETKSVCHLLQVGETTIEKCLGCHYRQPRRNGVKNLTPKIMDDKEQNARGLETSDMDDKTPDAPVLAAQPAARVVSSASSGSQPQPVFRMALVTRDNEPAPLSNLYAGASLFVILSGPSLKKTDLSLLRKRGIVTMGVNNSPAVFRPNLWIHGDPCYKFHYSIWRDPHVAKFMPARFFGQRLRIKNDDGKFELTDTLCKSMPNTFGYQRNAFFNPATFLQEDTVNWGNSKRSIGVNGNNHPHVLNIMPATLKVAYILGFRKVYLVGCDFKMTHDAEPYAFDQKKHDGAVDSNNMAYVKLNHMFNLLLPGFRQAGFEICNCTPGSGLLAFPQLALTEAVAQATKGIPDELDTRDWYTSDEGKPVRHPRRGRRRRGK